MDDEVAAPKNFLNGIQFHCVPGAREQDSTAIRSRQRDADGIFCAGFAEISHGDLKRDTRSFRDRSGVCNIIEIGFRDE